MQNILSIWMQLDMRRRVIVVLATVAMFSAVIVLSKISTQPRMVLLYAGLDSSAAGEVVLALDQRGVPYQIRGSSIFVDQAMRDELRMTLASEGLPENSNDGYELLDTLSGFGTTSQMFDAAYWRAKEGELARTIVASPIYRSARVHISSPSLSSFRKRDEASASVFVTPVSRDLAPEQANALRFLVASAVSGLTPENVSVIDAENGTVLTADANATVSQSNSKQAQELKQSVERILEARVGRGNAIVEVNVATDNQSESIVERTFDPEGRVAISTETEERSNSSSGRNGDSVTVASNLPDGDAASGLNENSSQNSETRERTNFEVSETQREILRSPGAIKRLTVAVLVDGSYVVDETGQEVWQPRSVEELNDLKELVSSAVGYDEARGDLITIRSLAFDPIEEIGTSATEALPFWQQTNLDYTQLVQVFVLGVVSLALGLFVVRPILTSQLALPAPEGQTSATSSQEDNAQQATDASAQDAGPPGLATLASAESEGFQGPMTGLPNAAATGIETDPVDRLKQLIEDRQEETAQVLRSWIEGKKENV